MKVYLLGGIILGEWFFFEPDIKALSFLLLFLVILPPHPVNVHICLTFVEAKFCFQEEHTCFHYSK